MIYEGKEYKEVTDGSAEIGDLIHLTEEDGTSCDVWRFTTDTHESVPDISEKTLGGRYILDMAYDKFTRYRYVEDFDETTANVFKEGDRVEIVGYSGSSRKITNGRVGEFMYVNDFGGCSVLLDGGAQLSFPPETLKLVEEAPVKFKSGDRVRLTEFELNGQINFGNFNGYVDGENFDGDYKVKFDDGAFGFFPPTSLELIEEKPAPKEKNIPLTDSLRYSACNTSAYKLKRSIKKLYEEMSELIAAKNENYGDSFSKQYKKYGMISVEIRLNDKMMRLEQLVKGEKDKVGESVEDTLKDIIGYATLALIELECEK